MRQPPRWLARVRAAELAGLGACGWPASHLSSPFVPCVCATRPSKNLSSAGQYTEMGRRDAPRRGRPRTFAPSSHRKFATLQMDQPSSPSSYATKHLFRSRHSEVGCEHRIARAHHFWPSISSELVIRPSKKALSLGQKTLMPQSSGIAAIRGIGWTKSSRRELDRTVEARGRDV
jgi:hypothetical protein